MLQVKNINYKIKNQSILQNVSIDVNHGQFVGIIGPNGSGKSTLLKNIYKVLKPLSGTISFHQKNVLTMSNRQLARQISVVAQENGANFDFTAEEVVQMGLYSRTPFLKSPNKEDQNMVNEAFLRTGMEALKERSFLTLSGGEKQRVLIARAFAQDTDMIILDEPTNHLDAGSQMKLLKLLKGSGKTVLTALHDLSLASQFCDHIYILQEGKVLCSGRPADIITGEIIGQLYGVDAEVFWHSSKMFIDYI